MTYSLLRVVPVNKIFHKDLWFPKIKNMRFRWALFIHTVVSLSDEPVLSLSDVRRPLAPPVPEPVFGNNPFGPQALLFCYPSKSKSISFLESVRDDPNCFFPSNQITISCFLEIGHFRFGFESSYLNYLIFFANNFTHLLEFYIWCFKHCLKMICHLGTISSTAQEP